MFRGLYDWTLRLAGHRHAMWAMAAISFAESSFFPIPPDVVLVPMIIARPDRAWRIALVATIASVVGGMLGYAIGYFLFESVGRWIVDMYGMQHGAEQFRAWYAEWGAWLILAKGLTPIPYKLVTIFSGIAGFNFGLFLLLSIITRGLRFFILAALFNRYGASIQGFIEKRLTLVCLGFLALIVGGIGLVALF